MSQHHGALAWDPCVHWVQALAKTHAKIPCPPPPLSSVRLILPGSYDIWQAPIEAMLAEGTLNLEQVSDDLCPGSGHPSIYRPPTRACAYTGTEAAILCPLRHLMTKREIAPCTDQQERLGMERGWVSPPAQTACTLLG